MADVARRYLREREEDWDYVITDFSPLTRKWCFTEINSNDASLALEDELRWKPDFALFWDFASLYQSPRTPEQAELFKLGLSASNVW